MKYCLFIFLFFSLTSCYSYKIYPKEYRKFEYKGKRHIAFVTNPELKRENKILQQSGIFILTSDSLVENCLMITLHPLQSRTVCGQAMVGAAITLGQVPIYFQDKYFYEFEVINKGDTALKKFELRVAQRYWFWDLFLFDKNFSKKAGKALLANYYSTITVKQFP